MPPSRYNLSHGGVLLPFSLMLRNLLGNSLRWERKKTKFQTTKITKNTMTRLEFPLLQPPAPLA